MSDAEPLQFAGTFAIVAVVTGIGWLLTVYCLIDRFDRKKDKHFIHITKDIINATFASIVVVAAVSIAFNVTIWLPEFLTDTSDSTTASIDDLHRGVTAIRDNPPSIDVPPPDLGTLPNDVDQLKNLIRDLITSFRNSRKSTFAEEIVAAARAGHLTDDVLTGIAGKHFGEINHRDGTMFFTIPLLPNTRLALAPKLQGKVTQ